MNNKVVNIYSKREKEFAYLWNSVSAEQRKYALATYILKYNDRNIVEKIYGKKINDIEFQQFKRMLKKYL